MEGKNVLEMFRLDGQVAVVTGASKGLGKAIALALAQAGANVVVTSRSRPDIEAAAKEIERGSGRKAIPVTGDVRQIADAEKARDAALKGFGGIHILVNSAGINIRKVGSDLTVEEFQDLI